MQHDAATTRQMPRQHTLATGTAHIGLCLTVLVATGLTLHVSAKEASFGPGLSGVTTHPQLMRPAPHTQWWWWQTQLPVDATVATTPVLTSGPKKPGTLAAPAPGLGLGWVKSIEKRLPAATTDDDAEWELDTEGGEEEDAVASTSRRSSASSNKRQPGADDDGEESMASPPRSVSSGGRVQPPANGPPPASLSGQQQAAAAGSSKTSPKQQQQLVGGRLPSNAAAPAAAKSTHNTKAAAKPVKSAASNSWRPPGATNPVAQSGQQFTSTAGAATGTTTPTSALPQPFIFKTPGAEQTLLIGCLLDLPTTDGHGQTTAFYRQPTTVKEESLAVYEAFKMAIKDVVPTLKLKRPVNINLTCLNSMCTHTPAYAAMLQLGQEGAAAVVGPLCSKASFAAAGVSGGIPVVSPASSSPQLSGVGSFFRTIPSDRRQGAQAALLARRLGISNIAIVASDSMYAHALALSFDVSFQGAGGNVVKTLTFSEGATAEDDPAGTPQAIVAELVKAKGARRDPIDGVFMTTGDVEFIEGFLRAVGKAKLDLPIVSGDASATPDVGVRLRDNPALLKPLTATTDTHGTPEFQEAFETAAPPAIRAFKQYTPQAYDAMTAVLKAYEDAERTTAAPSPADITQQLFQQKFEGATGHVEFNSKGDLIAHNGSYLEITFDTKTGELNEGRPLPMPTD